MKKLMALMLVISMSSFTNASMVLELQHGDADTVDVVAIEGYIDRDDVYFAVYGSTSVVAISGGSVTAAAPSDSEIFLSTAQSSGFVSAPYDGMWGYIGDLGGGGGTGTGTYIDEINWTLQGGATGAWIYLKTTRDFVTYDDLSEIWVSRDDVIRSCFVDADATTGANDGTSWADAFVHLQDALNSARNTPSITEIYVAQGTYSPDQGALVTSGDRTASFGLIKGVTITGGYAGYGEADPNARDVEAYPSILSGDLSGNDSDINSPADLLNNPTRAENSKHVLTANGVNETAVLDGFTITGGNAEGDAYILDKRGGALLNSNNGGPTIKNSKFIHNTAKDYGGAVYNYDDSNSNPTLIDCSFTENASQQGGAMMNHYNCSPTLLRCTFEGNLATIYGGAIRNLGETVLSACVFIDNRALVGGAIYNEKSNHTLTNCTFSGNSADHSGGAIVNHDNCNVTLTNCMFSANTASGSGPAYGGGAIWSDSGCTSNLTNCTFGGNSAVSYGGAIYDSNGVVYLDNSILWANTATYGQQIALQKGPTVSIAYCDIPNTPDAVFEEQPGGIQWGPGNIHDDPLFIDLGNDNLRLYDGSPCIDAGSNFALPPDTFDLDDDGDTAERTPLDIDGELRFSDDPATANTGVPDPPDYPDIVDIGADEYGPCGSPGRPYPPGDVNHDCKVDLQDIAIIGDNWLKRS